MANQTTSLIPKHPPLHTLPPLQQPQHRQILIQIFPGNPLTSSNQAPVVQLLWCGFGKPPVPIIRNTQFSAIFQQDIKALCGNAQLGCFDGFVFRWRGHICFLKLFCFSWKIRVLFNKSNTRRLHPKSLGSAKNLNFYHDTHLSSLRCYPPFVPTGLGNHPGVIGFYPCFVPKGTRVASAVSRYPTFRPSMTQVASGGCKAIFGPTSGSMDDDNPMGNLVIISSFIPCQFKHSPSPVGTKHG